MRVNGRTYAGYLELKQELKQLVLSQYIWVVGHDQKWIFTHADLVTARRVRRCQTLEMSSSETPCYTVIFESSIESTSAQDLRSGLEKGSDEVKIDTLRKILVSTINGNPQVSPFSLCICDLHTQFLPS